MSQKAQKPKTKPATIRPKAQKKAKAVAAIQNKPKSALLSWKKILRLFSFISGILIILILLGMIWMGFVPGISAIAGANTPKDLGIEYTGTDRANARMKSGMQYGSLPAQTPVENSIQRNGSIDLKAAFSSAELTALLNNRPYRYWPLEDVQLRINSDSSVEVSGRMISENLIPFGKAEKIPEGVADRIINLSPSNPVFYLKGQASIQEGKLHLLEVNRMQIGRVWIPMFIIDRISSNVLQTDSSLTKTNSNNYRMEEWLGHFDGFGAKEANFRDGKLFYEGTISAQELTVR